MIIPDYVISISDKLEQDFKSTCILYQRKGFSLSSVYGKIVQSGNKYIFIVLTTDNVKAGMTFWDEANKSKFQVTRVNKKHKRYPDNKTTTFIYLDTCEITYIKKDAKKR